ncbi:MAG TPA: hypothetical protein VGV16_06160 [Gammaproteobacteria bacterium]|nr:hypothetical protein [Gammaproteobacteria bacterium]
MTRLERIARRLVWWKPARQTLGGPAQLLARAMAYGTLSDLQALLDEYKKLDLGDVLEHAAPGVFDPRSWRYWHIMLGRPVPPLPVRTFGQDTGGSPADATRP